MAGCDHFNNGRDTPIIGQMALLLLIEYERLKTAITPIMRLKF